MNNLTEREGEMIKRCHVWTKHFRSHLYKYRGHKYQSCVRCGVKRKDKNL